MGKKKNKTEMTSLDKVSLLYGKGSWHIRGVPCLNLPDVEIHDGPLGLRKVDEPNPKKMGEAQETVRATCFPAPCLTSCSWDSEIVFSVGEAIGNEARAHDTRMILAPGVNIKRNPLCGRNFEYYSEDPLLSGKMGAAYINGIQSTTIGACLKHFACNSQESYRMVNDSIIDERALHEIYLKPFEIAVKESNPWAVMGAYNLVNGIYACESDFLLKDVLKGEWKYEGIVISDWGATVNPITSHNHGLDIEMPCFYSRKKRLYKALKLGVLKKEAVEDSSNRIVSFLKKANAADMLHVPAFETSRKTAENAVLKSCVLLKNEGTLPLKSQRGVCYIGELARTPHIQGGGSAQVNPIEVGSFISALSKSLKKDVSLLPFAPGYCLNPNPEEDKSLLLDAVDLASKSRVAVVFIGLTDAIETEGIDRKNIQLPENQVNLLTAVMGVCSNVVLVLQCGAPVQIPNREKIKAILLTYLTGEAGGEPIRKLLFGEACPCGKLAESWPLHLIDVPSFGFYPGDSTSSLYRESIYVGYRYYLTAEKDVAYPFGFGLSYAKFEYGDLLLSKNEINGKGKVKASIEVSNLSGFAAENVVELYAERKGESGVFRTKRTLIGFQKKVVPANGKATFEIEFEADALAHFDLNTHEWLIEDGVFLIEAGTSCETIVSSKELNAFSLTKCPSDRAKYPIYYNLSGQGFLQYDSAFEHLLGHPVGMKRDSRLPPYNMNSTISDIKDTFIGKKMIKEVGKRFPNASTDPEQKMMYKSALELPIRNLAMSGIPERFIHAILDMANGHFFLALGHILFGRRKLD